jgi:DNA-binding MarR family transcriptional regulator
MNLPPASPSSLGRSVLELLAAEGQAVSRSEIKRRLDLAESHLSHLLRDLEAAGLIVRIRTEKGREVLVDLGPEGRKITESALLPRWVERLAVLIAGATTGVVGDRDAIIRELTEAGAPSRAAADRLAQALTLFPAKTARPARFAGEIREPSLLERTETQPMNVVGPALEPWLEAAAAEHRQSTREYFLQALRQRLAADGFLPDVRPATSGEAAQWLDQIRRQAGPLGVPVRELVLEGRRR